MKKQFIKRSICILFAMLLMANMLTACSSSSANAEKETQQETQQAEVTKEEVVEEPTPEPTSEPTPEPTPEPISYEGIDMESTLPGIEWINTFEGIIDEPKLVVFNDETNKKLIVEKGDRVEISTGDIIGVYKAKGYIFAPGKNFNTMKSISTLCEQIVMEELNNTTVIEVEAYASDGEKTILSCTLVPSST